LETGVEVTRILTIRDGPLGQAASSTGTIPPSSRFEVGSTGTIPLSSRSAAALTGRMIVTAMALLPDDHLACVSGGVWGSTEIQLWNFREKTDSGQLVGHSQGGMETEMGVAAVALLPDGCLVSAGYDSTVRLWDLRTRMEITRLDFDAAILSLAVLPDGNLVAGDEIGRLHWLEIVH